MEDDEASKVRLVDEEGPIAEERCNASTDGGGDPGGEVDIATSPKGQFTNRVGQLPSTHMVGTLYYPDAESSLPTNLRHFSSPSH